MENKNLISIYLLFFCYFVLTSTLFGQSRSTNNGIYQKTYAYGLNLNTQQGLLGGLSFRYSKKINDKMYHSFSVEFVDIKDKKELRVLKTAGGFVVPGKQNFLYAIRPQYGRELILFHKAREKGVQVNLIGAIGPTLGIVAPYMIIYDKDSKAVKYNPVIHTSFDGIQGTGTLDESLSRAKFRIGASFKSSLVFEYSSLRGSLIGIELGFMADMFDKKITIMAFSEKKAFYSSAFLTLFYGIGK